MLQMVAKKLLWRANQLVRVVSRCWGIGEDSKEAVKASNDSTSRYPTGVWKPSASKTHLNKIEVERRRAYRGYHGLSGI